MAEVLSQSEVESLLAALDPTSHSPAAAMVPHRPDDFRGQISVYDFKRPERVSKDQIRAFQSLHESFSREFGASLSGMLRSIVEVKLISVDQLTYSEFVFSLENPTCFNLLESKGLDGHMILDLNPSIVFPIVDRLLGGGRNTSRSIPQRPLTDIEQRLASRIIELAIRALENAWRNICDLDLSIAQVESNPQLIQIVPPNEVVVLISFEITMGDNRGIMNLCIPFNTIEPLAGKLSSDTWAAYRKRSADIRHKLNVQATMSQASVELTVVLARTKLATSDLVGLAVGDVIVSDTDQNEGVEVLVESRPLFRGRAGVFKGHKAVRIGKRIARLQDLVEKKLKELTGQSQDNPSENPAETHDANNAGPAQP